MVRYRPRICRCPGSGGSQGVTSQVTVSWVLLGRGLGCGGVSPVTETAGKDVRKAFGSWIIWVWGLRGRVVPGSQGLRENGTWVWGLREGSVGLGSQEQCLLEPVAFPSKGLL